MKLKDLVDLDKSNCIKFIYSNDRPDGFIFDSEKDTFYLDYIVRFFEVSSDEDADYFEPQLHIFIEANT